LRRVVEVARPETFEEWWKAIAPHLTMARVDALQMMTRGGNDEARMYYKARKGWAEHDGSILNMSDDDIQREALAEVDDLTVYLAALRERRYRRMRQVTV